MALYERLLGYTESGGPLPPDQTGIPQHAFCGMMAERARGLITNTQIINAFNLDVGEVSELATLANRFTTGPTQDRLTRAEFEDAMYIASPRIAPYNTIAAFKARLGV